MNNKRFILYLLILPIFVLLLSQTFIKRPQNTRTLAWDQSAYEQRVNAGGSEYVDAAGKVWSADRPFTSGSWGYLEGSPYCQTNAIANTADPRLYQCVRFWTASVTPGYRFTVPNGSYEITLKFAEIYWNEINQRNFNLNIEGAPVLVNFDILASAGGKNKALDKVFNVFVNDGELTIDFINNNTDYGQINAIQIIKKTTYEIRVNAGGNGYADSAGNLWAADQAFGPGNWGYIGGVPYCQYNQIDNTADDQLYQCVHAWTVSAAPGYRFTVPNGTYQVILKFAEIYWDFGGQRKFNLRLEGNPVLSNYEIFADAGGKNRAKDKVFNVAVNDGELTIDFEKISDNPQVNAIQISKVNLQTEYDVVIAGGGEAGVGAAIQAARMGKKVAVLEETDWLGGMMTAAGVTSLDGNKDWLASGIFKEFIGQIQSDYQARGKSIGTCYWSSSSVCFEPSVGRTILNNMINQARNSATLDIFFKTYPVFVTLSGNRITGLTAQDGKDFRAKIFIDATEYGDLLALTPAEFRAGNQLSTFPNNTACVQDITYTAVMRKYPNGVPAELQTNGVTLPSNLRSLYETYKPGFAAIVTKTGSSNYTQRPVNWATHNAYRGMPDSANNSQNYTADNPTLITRTGINWANDYPYTVPNLSRGESRRQANCQAKLKTLLFIYYVQNDLGETSWAIANDEGYDTTYNVNNNSCPEIPSQFKAIERHFPQIPYIREGRRAVGLYTLTGAEIKRIGNPPNNIAFNAAQFFPSSVAVGDYPADLHACSANENLESYLGESRNDLPAEPYPFAGGPFQIPLNSLIPKSIDGLLLAGKNISATRLANGAARHQPISMLTGQAAGAIAGIAVSQNSQPRNVQAKDVQHELLSRGVLLTQLSDVAPADPKFIPVQLTRLSGIMYGYQNLTFGLSDPMYRKNMALVLVNMLRLPLEPKPLTPTFVDVPPENPYYGHIEAAYKAGLTSGCATNPLKYCPDDTLTKAQFAKFFMAAWTKVDSAKTLVSPSNPTYSDFTDINHWAYPYVESLALYGGANNLACSTNPLKLCPAGTIKREDLPYWIVKILQL